MTKSRSVLLFLLPAIALAGVVALWLALGSGPHSAPVNAETEAALSPPSTQDPEALATPSPSAGEPDQRVALDSGDSGAGPDGATSGAGHVLSGRVLRVDGTPVTSFTVELVRFSDDERRSKSIFARGVFEDEHGAFELTDVPAGEFLLVPLAEEHHPTGLFHVVVPTGESVLLEMVRAGRLTGVVHDPFGRPLPGARIRAGKTDHVCDGAGSFSIPAGSGGPGWLFASAEDFGPSAVREFDLELGESATFELHLTQGALITGQVLDAAGLPEEGVEVALAELQGDQRVKREKPDTDVHGRFAFHDLPAGSYLVVVDEGEGGGKLRLEQVTLKDGEARHVVLSGRVKDPIVLRVSLTRAGAPVSGASVHAFPEGPNFLANAHKGQPDESGRFEFELDQPGVYLLSVDASGTPGSMHRVVVPRAAVVERTVALPDGRLRGRVLDGAGQPAAKAHVWAERDGAWDPITLGQGHSVRTGDDGQFEFSGLEAGTWTVRARGARARTGLALEAGGTIEDIELREVSHGVARGRVLGADGSPLGRVAVFARDAGGRWVDSFADVASRPGTGAFVYEHLPAGDYTFLARHRDQVSAESEPLRVGPGNEATIELRLQPGALVYVTLQDRHGEPLAASFHVVDEHGRSFESLQSPHDLELWLEHGPLQNGRMIGPLPNGTYAVTGRAHDGRTMTGWVQAQGTVEQKLWLQLP